MVDKNLKLALKKLTPLLLESQDRNLNEADTRMRVIKMLSDVLGYDALSEVSSEQRIRERYVDFAIKLGGVIKFLIEVKAANTTLRDRHIEQAERYASQGNIPWVVLTNGVVWNLYHLTFDEGIDYEIAFSVDLSVDSLDTAASLLELLHRKSIIKGRHVKFWEEKLALGPRSLGKALFTEDVLSLIRRELRRKEGFMVDPEDLAKALQGLFTPEAREEIGPVRIRKSKARRKPRKVKEEAARTEDTPGPSASNEPASLGKPTGEGST